jgi:hypothetical protein
LLSESFFVSDRRALRWRLRSWRDTSSFKKACGRICLETGRLQFLANQRSAARFSETLSDLNMN